MPKKLPDGAPRATEPRKAPDSWDQEATRLLKVQLLLAGKKPKDLEELLKTTGVGASNPRAIAQRISRGSFTFGFALRVLRALGVDSLDLSKLPDISEKNSKTRE